MLAVKKADYALVSKLVALERIAINLTSPKDCKANALGYAVATLALPNNSNIACQQPFFKGISVQQTA